MSKIRKPTLVLNEEKCRGNINRMVDKCRQHGLRLRPHFKTHQSSRVGDWFREAGVNQCTVSSVHMARYFVKAGWKDITIAFPVNPREWEEIQNLQAEADLNIVVASQHVVPFLMANPPRKRLGVFIKIDVGTRRTGFRPVEEAQIEEVINALRASEHFDFKGFLSHAGHSYRCRSGSEVGQVHADSLTIFKGLRNRLSKHLPFEVSLGDTPSASVATDWEGVDEVRAGNFVYYDVIQWQIGSCRMEDIAVCLACPVVAKHDDRRSVIVYGGGVHLSKDRMIWDNKTIFGFPVVLSEQSLTWEMPDGESHVSAISQEHGVITAGPSLYDKLQIGDLVGILPVHSCMTADLMKTLMTTTYDRIEMMQYQ